MQSQVITIFGLKEEEASTTTQYLQIKGRIV
jgi:hypothetical protein